MNASETGWLADFIYVNGEFESGVAMMVDASGRITRFSRDEDDLKNANILDGRAILPGLVNVHSHAFQRAIRGRTEHRTNPLGDTFWTWRESMYHAANMISPEAMYHVARMAFAEMLLSGITHLGEFHYVHHDREGVPYEDRNLMAREILRAADDAGLGITLLRVAYVRAGWNKPPDPGQARFITPDFEDFMSDTDDLRVHGVRVGVAPHSVRAVPVEYLRVITEYAAAHNLPVHMHVAEQPAEVEACIGEYGRRPVELLGDCEILNDRFTAIHAIHITDKEAALLGAERATVCACPTSERNLGDGAVPADKLYEAGAALCFGSDSNVQIDILEDARLLEYDLRMNKLERVVLASNWTKQSLAKRLFASATESGARSLGYDAGSLGVGRAADFFTVDLNDPSIAGADRESLIGHIVFSLERTAVRDVVVAGKLIVHNGRHPMQEEIVEQFGKVQRELWA